jgi:integrase
MGVYLRKWNTGSGERRQHWAIKTLVTAPDGRQTLIRKNSEIDSRRGAEQEEQRLIAAVLDGSFGKREGVISVTEAVEEFVRAEAGLVRASTLAWYADQLRRVVVPELGDHLVDEIHSATLDEFRAKLGRAHKVSTVKGTLRALRRLLSFAHERGHLQEAPKIRLPKDTRAGRVPRFLTYDQADALIDAAERTEPELAALVLVGCRTGLRASELLALRWDDVRDLDGPGARLEVCRGIVDGEENAPKSGKARPVPLSPQAAEALRAHRRKHPRAVLVFGADDTTPRTRSQISALLRRLAPVAAIPLPLGPHSAFRHTFASHLAMRGVPLVQIRDLLGHASIQQTEVYAQLLPGSGRSVVALLDRAPEKSAAGRRATRGNARAG